MRNRVNNFVVPHVGRILPRGNETAHIGIAGDTEARLSFGTQNPRLDRPSVLDRCNPIVGPSLLNVRAGSGADQLSRGQRHGLREGADERILCTQTKTANYTALSGDSNTLLAMNSGTAQTITLPAAPPTGA